MFEYMSVGVFVIGLYFVFWKEIIEGNECGICVDLLNSGVIVEVIDYFVEYLVEVE